eukprot:scaffold30557_cov34-Cyclotella_meneghiniana.AAC.2
MFIASRLAPSVSSSIVTASILEHESKQGSIRPSASKNKECSFEDVEISPCENGELCADEDTASSLGGMKKSSGDVGILSCEIGELCAEDSTSSLGGRCVSISSNPADLRLQRERDLECEKCKGGESYGSGAFKAACVGVSDSDKANIACGSCNGGGACNFLKSGVTIGANSCLGTYACSQAQGEMNNIVILLNKSSFQLKMNNRVNVQQVKLVLTHVWGREPVLEQKAMSGRARVEDMELVSRMFLTLVPISILGMTVGKFLSCFNSYTEFVYVSTNPNLAAFNSAMGIMRAIGSMAMMYQMIGATVITGASMPIQRSQT